MLRTMRTLALLGCGLAAGPVVALVGGGSAWADSAQPGSDTPAAGEAELVTAPFTVDGIDKSNRKLTLRGPGGDQTTVTVPPDVQGFDKLKKGDKIDVDYYQSLAVSVLPPGSATPGIQEQEAQGSDNGAALRGGTITASAEVRSVNPRNNTIQFKGPNGKLQTVAVKDPALQQKLSSLSPGDVVQLKYTEAVVSAIRPHSKK